MEWQSMKSKSSGYESEGTKILKCNKKLIMHWLFTLMMKTVVW